MRKPHQLAGKIFGKLKVIDRNPQSAKHGSVRWNCICQCGKSTTVASNHLIHKSIISCGCVGRASAKAASTTHGMSKTSEYSVWVAMIQRCTNPNNRNYSNYGALGITVCNHWKESFQNFYSDMGPRPSKEHVLKRHQVNKEYNLKNCYWGTRSELKEITSLIDNKNKTVVKQPSEWTRYFGNLPSCI